MGHTQVMPTIFGEDNMSTIAMINNDSNSSKTKHIEIRFNLIREKVLKMIIELQHLATKEMTSDILTKALDPKPFTHVCTKLLGMLTVCDLHCSSRSVKIVSRQIKCLRHYKGCVVTLIYAPYYYVYKDRYVRITLLEYYYIFILLATLLVIFILCV